MMYSHEAGELYIAHATGHSDRDVSNTRQKLGEGLSGSVAKDRKGKLIRQSTPYPKERDRTVGTGLGLHFCRITVERWRGALGYEPRAGRGSRFWFRLPRAALRPASVEHADRAAGSGGGQPALGGE